MASYVITQIVEATPVTDGTGATTGYAVTTIDGTTRTVDAAIFEAFFAAAPPLPFPPEGNPL